MFLAILLALSLAGAQVGHAMAHAPAPEAGISSFEPDAPEEGDQNSHGAERDLHAGIADHTHDSPVPPSGPAEIGLVTLHGWHASAVTFVKAIGGTPFDRPPRRTLAN